jgi:hypothetical protein
LRLKPDTKIVFAQCNAVFVPHIPFRDGKVVLGNKPVVMQHSASSTCVYTLKRELPTVTECRRLSLAAVIDVIYDSLPDLY